jgi:hypothetical protein
MPREKEPTISEPRSSRGRGGGGRWLLQRERYLFKTTVAVMKQIEAQNVQIWAAVAAPRRAGVKQDDAKGEGADDGRGLL